MAKILPSNVNVNLGLEQDPFDKLLKTIDAVSKVQGIFTQADANRERRDKNVLDSLNVQLSNLAQTVDTQELGSVINMQKQFQTVQDDSLSSHPELQEEMSAIFSVYNTTFSKILKEHAQFDASSLAINNASDFMSEAVDNYNNDFLSGNLNEIKKQEHLEAIRKGTASLSINSVRLKGLQNTFPEKYAQIADNVAVSNVVQGYLLSQFEEELEPTELDLIRGGLGGKYDYNELKAKWGSLQTNIAGQVNTHLSNYEGQIETGIESWILLKDFVDKEEGGVLTDDEFTPTIPGSDTPPQYTVHKGKQPYKTYNSIQEIKDDMAQIKTDALQHDKGYLKVQGRVSGNPISYVQKHSAIYGGKWPWAGYTEGFEEDFLTKEEAEDIFKGFDSDVQELWKNASPEDFATDETLYSLRGKDWTSKQVYDALNLQVIPTPVDDKKNVPQTGDDKKIEDAWNKAAETDDWVLKNTNPQLWFGTLKDNQKSKILGRHIVTKTPASKKTPEEAISIDDFMSNIALDADKMTSKDRAYILKVSPTRNRSDVIRLVRQYKLSKDDLRRQEIKTEIEKLIK